jgi:hypothetical protein
MLRNVDFVYKTLMRPVVTYGAECWVLTKNDEIQLAVFERKFLRNIFGPSETLISGGGGTMKNCTDYIQNQKL